MATFKVYILPAGTAKPLPDDQIAIGNNFTGELGQNLRTIVLSGTMRLYHLGQLVLTTDGMERRVKESLINSGWGIQSVSITRNSYLNNTLNVTIVVNALGDDISQRVDDGITNHLINYILDGDKIFQNVNLRVTADTGYKAFASVAGGVAAPPRTTAAPKKTVKKNTPINVGTIATVTVSASDETPDDASYNGDNLIPNFPALTPTTMIVGGILLVLLIDRL